MELAPRKQKILAAIVKSYISTGEPVGSKALLDMTEMAVSSATVRNEMADLEKQGYLFQPHTSAGRVPSQKGYRFFVENFLNPPELGDRVTDYIDSRLEQNAKTPEGILKEACKTVSDLTGLAAVGTSPAQEESRIMQIKFAQTGSRTAMAVLVTSTGSVKSNLFRSEYTLNEQMLRVFEQALNKQLAGLRLCDLTQPLIQTVAASFGELALMMPPVLTAIKEAADAAGEVSSVVSGQIKLLFSPEIDFETSRNLVAFLSREENIATLASQMGTGLSIKIGRENTIPELFNCSVAAVRYEIYGSPAGMLAVLGPIRMDYEIAAAVLRYTAQSVSEFISEIIRI